jgi:hypothetical protein
MTVGCVRCSKSRQDLHDWIYQYIGIGKVVPKDVPEAADRAAGRIVTHVNKVLCRMVGKEYDPEADKDPAALAGRKYMQDMILEEVAPVVRDVVTGAVLLAKEEYEREQGN